MPALTMAARDLSRFEIHRQPDDTTCGPTCLHAIYRHFGEDVALDELLGQVATVEGGGTLGVLLATHALSRGYDVTIVSWNLQTFDPTWFDAPPAELRRKLLARAEAIDDPKQATAARAYVDFLDAGGRLRFDDLERDLLRGYLERGLPILTGLSATFLYREARELSDVNRPDDVAGDPVGHFVVLTGYRSDTREVLVTDPMHPNPLAEEHTYPVGIERVIGAVYLGVLTYDGNLVVLEPPDEPEDGR